MAPSISISRLGPRRLLVAGGMGLLLLAAPDPGRADSRRQGSLVGGVVGRGAGSFDVGEGAAMRSSDWSSGGNVVRGRLGWVLTPELVLTGEYGVWRRRVGSDAADEGAEATDGPVDRYVGAGLVAINLYPRIGGFLLRAGLGYGQALAEVRGADGVSRAEAEGPVIVLGMGYEFFLSRGLSMTLGVDYGRIHAGEELSGNFAQYTAAFHVYFPEGFPRDWF